MPDTRWQDYLLNKQNYPGASSDDIAGQYYTRKTLGDAGWNQRGIDFAQQVPTTYGPGTIPGVGAEAASGAYQPGAPGEVRVRLGNGNFIGGDRFLSTVLEHEMMHAWENPGNPGGSMGIPASIRKADHAQALYDSGYWSPDGFAAIDHGGDHGWRGTDTPSSFQTDDAHLTQDLFKRGFRADQIPQWYRDKYLDEYNP